MIGWIIILQYYNYSGFCFKLHHEFQCDFYPHCFSHFSQLSPPPLKTLPISYLWHRNQVYVKTVAEELLSTLSSSRCALMYLPVEAATVNKQGNKNKINNQLVAAVLSWTRTSLAESKTSSYVCPEAICLPICSRVVVVVVLVAPLPNSSPPRGCKQRRLINQTLRSRIKACPILHFA